MQRETTREGKQERERERAAEKNNSYKYIRSSAVKCFQWKKEESAREWEEEEPN